MTLIVSHLDRNGIVMASDSNITTETQFRRESQKVFAIPALTAGVGIAGCWSIADTSMDEWIARFINRYHKGHSLEDFVEDLRSTVEHLLTPEQKQIGTLIHVAGYVPDERKGFHPEHWIISNVEGIENDGNYTRQHKDVFHKSEDFWRLDVERQAKYRASGFEEEYNGWTTYANGLASGRIAYMHTAREIQKSLFALWDKHGEKGWYFRPPKTIGESRRLVELYMDLINRLFELSDSPAPYVGGTVHSIEIPMPAIHC